MIKEIKERQVSVKSYEALIRDGKVTDITKISHYPDEKDIEDYIAFLKEIEQAIEGTKKPF